MYYSTTETYEFLKSVTFVRTPLSSFAIEDILLSVKLSDFIAINFI